MVVQGARLHLVALNSRTCKHCRPDKREPRKGCTARLACIRRKALPQSSKARAGGLSLRMPRAKSIGSLCVQLRSTEGACSSAGQEPAGNISQPGMAVHHVPADRITARLVKSKIWQLSYLIFRRGQRRPKAPFTSKRKTSALQHEEKIHRSTSMALDRQRRIGCLGLPASADLEGATLKVSYRALTEKNNRYRKPF